MAILLVDDDRDLVDVLSFVVRRAGLSVVAAYDAPKALRLLESERPELAVIDVNLGGSNGFDLLRALRPRSNIPVIMLTARDAEDDKVLALELGADDYVTKPFGFRELTARIRAHLRRVGGPAASQQMDAVLTIGPLTISDAEHTVRKDDREVRLTVTEFRLLRYLAVNAGTVVPTRAILRQVWGYDEGPNTDVVRVAIHRLRQKIEEDPNNPRLLHTVPGVGAILKPGAPPSPISPRDEA